MPGQSFAKLATLTLVLIATTLVTLAPASAQQTDRVDALISAAMEAKNAGKFDVAIATLQTALDMSPNNEKVLIALGRVHGAKNEMAKAEAFFRKALGINPRSVDASRFLALTLLRQQKVEEALQQAQHAAQLGPRSLEAHIMLAEMLLATGKFREATAAAKEVVEINAEFAEGHRLLATAYRASRNLRLALRHAKRAVKLAPDHLASRLTLAGIYAEQENVTKAASTLKRAERIAGTNPRGVETIAAAYTLIGKTDDAIRLYKTLIRAHPTAYGPQVAIANVYLRCKRAGGAL